MAGIETEQLHECRPISMFKNAETPKNTVYRVTMHHPILPPLALITHTHIHTYTHTQTQTECVSFLSQQLHTALASPPSPRDNVHRADEHSTCSPLHNTLSGNLPPRSGLRGGDGTFGSRTCGCRCSDLRACDGAFGAIIGDAFGARIGSCMRTLSLPMPQ